VNDPDPFGTATDEAVSASIDGELAGFAAERRMSVDEVEQRLHAWSGFETRRDELEQAREAVATDLLPLTPVAQRRLVEKAAAAASRMPDARRERRGSPSRRRLPWRPMAAAAAVLALVVGIGFAVAGSGGGGGSASSKSSSLAAPKVQPGAFVGEVGDVSDAGTLRMLLTTREAGLPTHAADAQSPAEMSRTQSKSAPAAGQASTSTSEPAPGARESAMRCAAAVDPPRAGHPADTVVLLATARFQGRDAVVIGVRREARSIVFVADRATCAVLTSQSV